MQTQIADAPQTLDMRPLTDAETDMVNGGLAFLLFFAFEVGMLAGVLVGRRVYGGHW